MLRVAQCDDRADQQVRFVADPEDANEWINTLALTAERDGEVAHATVEWRGHLVPDGYVDVVLVENDCGSGECMRGLYLRCPSGGYLAMFHDYTNRLRVTPRRHGWAALATQSLGERDAHGGRDSSWFPVPLPDSTAN